MTNKDFISFWNSVVARYEKDQNLSKTGYSILEQLGMTKTNTHQKQVIAFYNRAVSRYEKDQHLSKTGYSIL